MNVIEKLTQKNNTAAYHSLLELEAVSADSGALYGYFEDFLGLLSHKSSFVRVRGFRMCCAQARWDSGNKLGSNLPVLLKMLEDEKPAAVRQCLTALPTLRSFLFHRRLGLLCFRLPAVKKLPCHPHHTRLLSGKQIFL